MNNRDANKSDINNINSLISDYYETYYRVELGLKDWKNHVKLRLNEEENYCNSFIDWVEEWINYDFSNKKVLVIGCGTGGEIINFHKRKADVYGIEPNPIGIKISLIKAKLNNISEKKIIEANSESLPFSDEKFDFIYCFTVLEHVRDVKKSLYEMVRVTKPGGKIFIETPDYRQLYEGHYKLPLPMFLPKWFNKILLIILGRPTSFIESIQKVNSKKLLNIFNNLPVTALRIFRKEKKINFPPKNPVIYFTNLIQNFIYNYFHIQINQIWILHREANDKDLT